MRGAHQGDHAARMRHGVGPENQPIDHAECRGGHPDAQRERDHHECGKSGRPAQAAKSEAHVLHYIFNEWQSSRDCDSLV